MLIVCYTLRFKSLHLNQLNKNIFLFLLFFKKEFLSNVIYAKKNRITKKSKSYTVMKSPDVNKSAREQFKTEIKTIEIELYFSLEDLIEYNIEDCIEENFGTIEENVVGVSFTKRLITL